MSGRALPRTYWCHADYDGSGTALPLGATTIAPGQAVEWMRDAVRGVIPVLDRASFEAVWSWLGDHRALDVAVAGLRRGQPYVFAVSTPEGTWTWTVLPVSVLPLATECVTSSPLRTTNVRRSAWPVNS